MRRSPISLRLSVAILVLAALPVLGGWWAWKGQGPLRQEATVLVKKGTSINQMADQLEREGVIRSASLFKLWARARKLQLIRGEYTFKSQASLSEVAGKLRRAEIHYTTVSIPEGARRCRWRGRKCLSHPSQARETATQKSR